MPVQLIDCIFEGNTATGNGGAVGGISGAASISHCLFTGNLAEEGGAVFLSHGSLEMEFCTFAGNSALDGGALHLTNLVELELNHCSLHGNAAAQGGAISLRGTYNSVQNIATSILAFGPEGEGLYWDGEGILTMDHMDIHANAGGDWSGAIADLFGVAGNVDLDPLFCDAAEDDFTLREDSPCLPAGNPDALLIGAHGQGCGVLTGLPDPGTTVLLKLRGAHPNPFNPRVTIHFEIATAGRASLRIFGSDGRLVAVLADREFGMGSQGLIWDGLDSSGRPAPSGVYHAMLKSGGSRETLKLILLR
jgi:hypothetical protein